jgi:tRNA G26 N,N-dimethylase Trm1
MYSSTHSLTSALDGGELSASRPGHFTPRERPLVPIGQEAGLRDIINKIQLISSFEEKVKVKLSLCLSNHHAMRVYWEVEEI